MKVSYQNVRKWLRFFCGNHIQAQNIYGDNISIVKEECVVHISKWLDMGVWNVVK
jgi:hypothetical protein